MTEEEKKDILFQIDMQLYDEFNDTIATMNDHLGDVYSLRDIEEVEKAEKEKEIRLLREAVKKLQKENKIKDKVIDLMAEQLSGLTIFDMEKDEPIILVDEEVKDYFYKKVEVKDE